MFNVDDVYKELFQSPVFVYFPSLHFRILSGTALAEVLFGDIAPSGKLPFTFPKKLEDSPAFALGNFGKNASEDLFTLMYRLDATGYTREQIQEYIAQLYVKRIGSAVERPLKELEAFDRITLKAGETKKVTLEFPVSELTHRDKIQPFFVTVVCI